MSDISMCDNPNCKIKDFCFRHLATPSKYQVYLIIDKHVDNNEDCAVFWECTSKETLDKLNERWRD